MANQWGTLQIEVPLLIPPEVLAAINELADFLVNAIDVALLAMELAQVAVSGFLDPAEVIVQAIIAEIHSVIRDFNQTGIYITGDWHLRLDQLQGGFQAYEHRMIGRLTDTTDPTRPDVSNQTQCLGVYLYISDGGQIERIEQFLRVLAAFFNQHPIPIGEYPIPKIKQVLYGTAAATLFDMADLSSAFTSDGSPPQSALVQWGITPSVQHATLSPFPTPAPGGFIITVSTVANGIELVYDRPKKSTAKKKSDADATVLVQPREYGRVVTSTGQPFTLYGGYDMINLPATMEHNVAISNGHLKDAYVRVYGHIPATKTRIPLEQLLSNTGTYYFQRVFYLTVNQFAAWLTGEFSQLLNLSQMPHAAHVNENADGTLTIVDDGLPDKVYVRIASTSQQIAAAANFQYTIEPSKAAAGSVPIAMADGGPQSGASSAISRFSAPTTVVFPNANTQQYLTALKNALVVLALSRPDLDPIDALPGTVSQKTKNDLAANLRLRPYLALQRNGLEPFMNVANSLLDGYRKSIEVSDDSPQVFCQYLKKRIDQLAHDIYAATGPMPDIEAFIVQNTKNLQTATVSQILLSAHPTLNAGLVGLTGGALPPEMNVTLYNYLSSPTANTQTSATAIGRNPYSLGLDPIQATAFIEYAPPQGSSQPGRIFDRDPQMQAVSKFPTTPTWPDTLPTTLSTAAATAFMAKLPPGLKTFYQYFIQPDGSLLVWGNWALHLQAMSNRSGIKIGSADTSPVFVIGGPPTVPVGTSTPTQGQMFYCRGTFAKALNGKLYQEAALALGIAASAVKRPENTGAWFALRVPSLSPQIDQLMAQVENWAESIASAIKSGEDQLQRAIASLEARAVELQQLIQRIDAILNSLLGTVYTLPPCSAMVTISNGTYGLLGDLVSSQDQPADGATAYGGGFLMVIPIPIVGGLALDLLQQLLVPQAGPPPTTGALASVPSVPGIGGLPTPPPPSAVPDPL